MLFRWNFTLVHHAIFEILSSMSITNFCPIHCAIECCYNIWIYPYYSDKALLAQNVPSLQINALRIDFFLTLCLLAWTAIKQREEKWKKLYSNARVVIISRHIDWLPRFSINFWGTTEVLQSHIENLQTLISTEITHQRLLPLNWRPDSEFSISFLD